MCGICGSFAAERGLSVGPVVDALVRMQQRGPDDTGLAVLRRGRLLPLRLDQTDSDAHAGLHWQQKPGLTAALQLGHTRFSIQDLDARSHQPMISADGHRALVFNGEIYNYLELRTSLQQAGCVFRTGGDTEVLLQALCHWGVQDTLARLQGFYAFAYYDASSDILSLVRDRIGQAPLYYAHTDTGLHFASELEALFALVGDDRRSDIRQQAVLDFAMTGLRDYGHRTMYEGICSLPQGTIRSYRAGRQIHSTRYWHLPDRRATEAQLPVDRAATELRATLQDAVALRLRADVPIALELSGGMDSSVLAALAAATGTRLSAYTVAFPGEDMDEEPFARQVAGRWPAQLDYHVIKPVDAAFSAAADSYVARMAEPYHSPNMLTNFGIWQQMAETGVRVSLNGAAGDELFAGYPWDTHIPWLHSLLLQGNLAQVHKEIVTFTEGGLQPLQLAYWRRWMAAAMPPSFRASRAMQQLAQHRRFVRVQGRPHEGFGMSLDERMQANMGDMRMNYWLRSGHQSFMGVPIEVRMPFLDHRVVELAFSMPVSYLIRDGWHKWILRRSFEDVLPAQVVWRRRKQGFPFPFARWFAHTRPALEAWLRGFDSAWLDLPLVFREYDMLRQNHPTLLWRLCSIGLWEKRVVRQESLV